MNSLNSFFVKNYFLNLFIGVFLFSFYPDLYGQKGPERSGFTISPQGHLTINSIPDYQYLTKRIEKAKTESGLSVSAQALNLKVSLNHFKRDTSYAKKQLFSLTIFEQNIAFNFNAYAAFLAKEDYVVVKNNNDSIIINSESVNKNPFLRNLANNTLIHFYDLPPYNNSQFELNNFSMHPVTKILSKNNDFGDAGSCQVNANCYADNPNFKAIDAAVLIQWRNANFIGFCTGSLVVNSNYDNTPYILTAEHCALFNGFVSNADLNNWVFFFNYESVGCENPGSNNGLNQKTLTGAQWVARSNDQGGETGSDFLLLKLNSQVPDSYQAHFAGWNRSGFAPLNGRSYHHPQGDIKKVSAYYYSPILGSFGESQPNTHWLVNWSSSSYGFGTTEEGSSGSALLDENGLVRGILTGGSSSCSNPSGLDYYGTMAYSWTSNGSAPENQLKPWLDPANTGYLIMPSEQAAQKPREINIAPNPVLNGNIQLVNIGVYDQEIELVLFEISGQTMAYKKAAAIPGQGINLKVPHYAPGLYILQFKQGADLITQKVMLL